MLAVEFGRRPNMDNVKSIAAEITSAERREKFMSVHINVPSIDGLLSEDFTKIRSPED